jgi:hypothetical protein
LSFVLPSKHHAVTRAWPRRARQIKQLRLFQAADFPTETVECKFFRQQSAGYLPGSWLRAEAQL